MKRIWVSLVIALSATMFMMWQNGAFAEKARDAAPAQVVTASDQKPGAQDAGTSPTISIDKTSISNGGAITVTGTAPAGKPVYIEVWSDEKVRVSRFDADVDKETGKRPYILYMTEEMPAYYKIFMPRDKKDTLDGIKKEGKNWSVSKALKDLGADIAYSAPSRAKIDRYQATLMGSVIGSRGDLLSQMDEKESRKRSMQLIKARFRSPDKVLSADVEVNPDGTFKAALKIREGLAPGKYSIVAVVDKGVKSQPVTFENTITLPNLYLSNAGTSLNLIWPFLLSLAISIFGVLMGA
jgi:uncharacterized protein